MSELRMFWLIICSYILGILSTIPAVYAWGVSSWGCDPSYNPACTQEVLGYFILALLFYGAVTTGSMYLFFKNSAARRSYRVTYEMIYIIGLLFLGLFTGPGVLVLIMISMIISFYITRYAMNRNLYKRMTSEKNSQENPAADKVGQATIVTENYQPDTEEANDKKNLPAKNKRHKILIIFIVWILLNFLAFLFRQ